MGFLRDQRSKWRARHQSACASDETAPLESPLRSSARVELTYSGGPLGLTLQRSKAKWLDGIGPTKISWCKDQRLGITFHERRSAIAIKELSDDARSHPTVCVGMELIGVNGEPIAGLELDVVMTIIRQSPSPCELAFTPPPSPILVTEVAPSVASCGVASGHVLVSVNGEPMLGCSLQDASDAIGLATQDSPIILHFASLHAVLPATTSDASRDSSHDIAKKSLRNTLCIAAVAAALSV